MKNDPIYENFRVAALKVCVTAESVANISAADIAALSVTTDKTKVFFENMRQTLADELQQQENEVLCSSIATQLAGQFPNIEAVMESDKVMVIYLEGKPEDDAEKVDTKLLSEEGL